MILYIMYKFTPKVFPENNSDKVHKIDSKNDNPIIENNNIDNKININDFPSLSSTNKVTVKNMDTVKNTDTVKKTVWNQTKSDKLDILKQPFSEAVANPPKSKSLYTYKRREKKIDTYNEYSDEYDDNEFENYGTCTMPTDIDPKVLDSDSEEFI